MSKFRRAIFFKSFAKTVSGQLRISVLTENMENRLLWVAALLAVHVSNYQKIGAGLIINGKILGLTKD
jgi:hypothetical protein